ncbi:hypothetical protein JXA34_03265 [Patescibacteria group bacterium]|nr:hypothetical protein [Patescibacteria group bacterium]
MNFGQGAFITQDIDALFWDAASDYLGLGTSNPQYTLDVDGSVRISTFGAGAGNTIVLSNSGVLETRDIDSRVWGTSSLVDVTSPVTNYVARLSDVNSITISQIWDDGSYVGIGTSDPQYTLDVSGSVRVASGSSLYLGTISVGDTTSGVVIEGNTYIKDSGDLYIGDIGVGDSSSATASGAYLIGVFDEFVYSDHTRLQDILNDFDNQMGLLGGGSSKWTDLGAMTTLTQQTDNLTVGGSTPQAGLYFVSSTGSLSLDNYAFYYDGFGRLGLGDSTPGYILDVGGTAGVQALVLGDTPLTSSASELNILTGATLSTSELNMLTGATMSTAELNYLTGSTVLNGGVVFGDGSGFSQDIANIFWDDISDRLGIGTSAPGYTLDVGGTGAFQALVLDGTALTASTSELNILAGVSVTGSELDYLSGATIFSGGVLFGNGTNISQDLSYLYWDDSSKYLGVGTSLPGYTLDVGGTGAVQALVLGGIAVTSDASELNILDGATVSTLELNILSGATLSTSELNILNGVTSTTAELNYLDGTTVLSGGINFGQGAFITQDIDALFWDATSDYLGLGTSNPQYTLDVGGTASVQTLVLGGSVLTSSASELNILSGISVTGAELDYLSGSAVVRGGVVFADGNNFTQDVSEFYWDTASKYLGLGTSNPSYALDVEGDVRISSGSNLYLGSVSIGDTTSGVRIGGDTYIVGGGDLMIGDIGLSDSGSAVTSGAYLIGVYDEFTYSDHTRLQAILNDFDAQMGLLGGGSSKWTDLGSMTTLTQQTDNLTVGGSTPQAGLYFVASAGSLSLDNYAFYYNGSGRLGIGDSTPEHMLDVGGTAAVEALVIGGFALKSSIAELNILDGATLSTSELNKLTGISVTGAELDYLSGATVQQGGLVFGDGARYAQDVSDIYWDNVGKMLGIGTSAPGYTLDIGGTGAMRALVLGGQAITSSAAEINILDGVVATTSEINILNGVTSTTAELNYLDGTTVLSGGINFGQGAFITQDVDALFWDATSDYLGLGTSNPQYTLDVDGSVRVSTLGAGSGNTVVLSNSGVLETRDIDSRVWGTSALVDVASPVANYVTKLSDTNTLVIGQIWDNGSLIGIGKSNPSYLLDIAGTTATQGLVLAGTAITADAVELNIMDGVTATTSDINILSGATLSTSELNYLTGSGVVSGGLVFGDGTKFTQDAPNISWDNSTNRLGIGTSNPQYTLDINGDVAISSGSDLYLGSISIGDTTNGIAIVGSLYVSAGSDYYIGDIGIGDSGSALTSGASLIGIHDEFTYSDETVLQAVLKDLDTQLGLGASKWTDAGTYIFANNASSYFGIDDSTGYTGIGTTNPQYQLDVGGTAAVRALVLGGTGVTSSASELNILAGATLSTSELNKLTGTSVTSTELDYLFGATVIGGGILFGDGSGFTQDASNFFWNNASDYLGVGTSNPQYTLDINGDVRVASGSDLLVGSIGLGDSGSAVTSGAILIGVYDEFTYSDSTRLQDVLDDFDNQMTLLGGGSSKWTDLGAVTTLTQQTDNLTVGGSTPQAALYFVASTGSLSLDNYAFYYDGSGRLGIGDSTPEHMLDVGGTASVQALMIGGSALTSSINELNILTGATLSTSELNKLTGTLVTGTELDYLSGSTVLEGGIIFADSSGFVQDTPNIFWDDTSDRLGIGTSAPQYTLDVGGDIRVSSGSTLYLGSIGLGDTISGVSLDGSVYLTFGSDLHIGDVGIGDSSGATTSGARLIGVYDEFANSQNTRVQDVLDDLDAEISDISTGASGIWRDEGSLIFPATYSQFSILDSGLVGIGLTNPSYTLDVGGTASVQGLVLAGTAISADAAELNILDGVTASTSEINLLQGATLSTSELNYLTGSGVTVGGLVFGDGTNFTQDTVNMSWDDSANRLGIGTSSPQYTLDVSGDIRISSSNDLLIGTIGLGDSASAVTSGAYLIGVYKDFTYSDQTTVQAVLKDFDSQLGAGASKWTDAGTYIFANNASSHFGIKDSTGYTGIGTTNPQYMLDVHGDIGITSGSVVHLGAINVGDTTSGLTLSGNVYLPSGSDYHLGDIGLGDSNLATASGAYLVGVYDEFTYSSSTKLQDVLDDLDLEINNIATGASGIWIDEGTLIYPTTYNQFAIMDSGFIGVGTTSPLYTLDVGGTGSVQALVLGGQAVTSSAAEINILDGVVASTSEINILSGATLSTSELNILNGALLSTAELNYLNGTTVLSGGINFGQGTFITQDIDALFWNAFSNYLGLGTSNPQYTLDVGGTGSMQALILGGQAVKSSASELNILDGVTATTSEINKLAGVSVTGAELDYLFGSSVFSGGMVFGNGSSFAQDLANIYWNDSFDRLGVGTSAPSYTLDVGGTAGVRALVINGVGLTSSAAELNILTGATVSTAELNKLTGVSVTGAELDYLSGAGVLNGGLVFGNGSGLAQDVSQLYWDAGADRLGIGLTNPSYTLEVSGDVGVVSGNTLYLGSVGIGDTTSGIAIGGSTYITGGGDIYIGDIGLGNSGSATTSGAYLVGVYDEFTYSTSTKVQDVLDDLDNQLYQVISGQSGLWMDAGFYYYASNASSNFAIEDTTGFLGLGTTNPAYQLDVGGTAAIQAIILGSTAVTSSASELNKLTGVSVTGAELDYLSGSTVIGGGVMFANGTILTQDTPNFFWDNAADQLGIGLSNPQYTLDVGGTGALQALVLGGTPLTSSASELNILDGATLSTSELNILAGATLDTSELNTLNGILSSTSELNYLNGSSVFVGGLVYGDGTKLIQDVSKLYWDADSDRLGIGLTNPAYTLEVSGNVGIVTGNTLYLGSIAVGDTTSGITIGGNTYITESSDLYIGDIGLGDSASAATSGAYLIGVYDEFTYSNNTRAQDVLDDLDTQLYQLTSGLTGLWMDAGVYYYASNAESTFGIEDTTGFLGLGTTNPAYQLDVGGTASVQALILGGTGVTASASELNIMDGITATTSELNKLTGVSVSGTELDYLSGSSVFSGGIVFADGTKLTQDMDNLYWDSSNNFLGIGFTSPSYNLDVAGTINTINLHINSVTVTSTAAEINKLTGVSVTSTELDYLNGSAILAGGILFADGGKFTQDINDLYWDQTNNFFGIGLTDPSYNLDVAGTINTTNLHINSVAVTSSAAELNYLDNTTILSGGIIFADGDKLAQDINYLFWDATNKFLGLGLTNPGYNLDVGGSINTTDLFVNNIGVGGSDSATTSGAFLVGVFDEFDTSDSTRLQAVLNDFDSDIYDLSTGMAGIWRDAGSYIYPINASAVLGIKDSTGFLGVGTTNPQYNLDVGGSINTTNLFLSGDIISSAATPSITISDGEIFTVADAATPDTFTINTNGSLMSFSDGSNSFTFDVDSGPSYAGNARPTRQVTLSPEYAGAVLTGDGGSNTGTMTTDFCENGASSDIPNTNTSVCNTSGDVHNYYSWTTAEASAQDYDIWIRWRVPDNFSAWVSNPVDVYAKRTDASNNAVTVYVYDTAGALENAGGTQVAGTSWTQTTVEATFAGTYTAGSYMTIRIVMTADTGGDSVQVGEISLDYLTSN